MAPQPTSGLAISDVTAGSWVGLALLAGGLTVLVGSLIAFVVGRLRRH
jgi:hypothetical protein